MRPRCCSSVEPQGDSDVSLKGSQEVWFQRLTVACGGELLYCLGTSGSGHWEMDR